MSNENSRSIDNSSTQDEVRAYLVDWLESHLPAEWVRAIKDGDAEALKKVRDHVPVDEWFDGLAAARLVAPDWPVEYGGLGLTGDQRRVVSTELSRYKTPRFFNPIGINLVGPALLRWGTEEQKAAHLRPIASHREIWCQLFSEPGAGSDLAGLATMSTRADGGGWLINGSKIWSSFAHLADWGIILTRSDPDRPKHEGVTVFLLDMKTPGITIRPLRHITGDHEFNQTFYDDVAVPDSARLGPVNEGWTVAQTMLMNERTAGGQGAALPGTVSGRSVSGVIAHHTPVTDPELRRRLAQMWIEDQLIQLTNKRIVSRRRACATHRARGLDHEAVLQRAHAAHARPSHRSGGPERGSVARGRPMAQEHRLVVPTSPVQDHRRRNQRNSAQHSRRARPRSPTRTRTAQVHSLERDTPVMRPFPSGAGHKGCCSAVKSGFMT